MDMTLRLLPALAVVPADDVTTIYDEVITEIQIKMDEFAIPDEIL